MQLGPPTHQRVCCGCRSELKELGDARMAGDGRFVKTRAVLMAARTFRRTFAQVRTREFCSVPSEALPKLSEERGRQ
jgi:hypothetical protein